MDSVDIIAGGYEWICPKCETMHKEIEVTEKVCCEICFATFETNLPIDLRGYEANARLIAAAPALLEACKTVTKRFTAIAADGGTLQEFLDAGSFGEIVAVIAIAEGS